MAELKLVKNESKKDFDRAVLHHRIRIALKWTLIIGGILAVYFLIRHYFDTRVYTRYEILKKTLRSDSENAEYMVYNYHVLKYSRDGAESFNDTEEINWNVTYEMQEPFISTCGDFVAMGDIGSTEIIVIDGSGKQTSIKTKLPIMSFTVAGQGIVAAVLEEGTAARINIYDRDGALLAGLKNTMGKSGYPIDLCLSPNGTLLGISYVRMVQNSIRSSIAFYNFSDVGQNEIDHYVSGYDYEGTIFPRIRFLNNSTAVAVGDDRLIFYTGSQKPELKTETVFEKEIQSVHYGDSEIGLVFRSESGGSNYKIQLYDTGGSLEVEQEFNMDYTDIELANGLIIVYNDIFCQIFNKKGLSKYEGVFEDPVLLMVPTGSVSKYVLINRNMAQLIELN